MLIRSSGPIDDSLQLLTLGESCRYLVTGSEGCGLVDCGLTAHVPALITRLERLEIPFSALHYLFITHPHPEKIGGIAALLRTIGGSSKLQLVGSAAVVLSLKKDETLRSIYDEDQRLSHLYTDDTSSEFASYDEFKSALAHVRVAADSDLFSLGSAKVRAVSTPGHLPGSLAYYVQPANHLITDEGLGYYRGRLLSSFGGDENFEASLLTIRKLADLPIETLCLPFTGALTGTLVRKHFTALLQNADDLIRECKEARAQAISDVDIKQSIFDSFYSSTSGDPVYQHCLSLSLEALWAYVQKQLA